MNSKLQSKAVGLTLIAALLMGVGCASTSEDSGDAPQAQNLDEGDSSSAVETAEQSDEQPEAMEKGSMMGGEEMKAPMAAGAMNAKQMMSMIQKCRSTAKEKKMCGSKVMKKCQETSTKEQCMTVMNQLRAQRKNMKKTN